ncbi:MAG: PIN domain-containing protein [Propionibacteriaceae bacterium]|jgi:predicted nucleic acid-binding protein|nr:PIN domain-containing protein [Propionibacteriaceae bacterium]
MPTRAVLDACVLVPISLCDVLLELSDVGLYEPLWSEPILKETRRSLMNKLSISETKADHRIQLMRAGVPTAMVSGFDDLIDSMGNDPKDRHVLAVAVHMKCPLIVTANLTDFPDPALSPYGVKAIHPDEFLCELFDDDEQAVWEAIDHKRSLYRKPPLTMAEVGQSLTKTVPRFAARLIS